MGLLKAKSVGVSGVPKNLKSAKFGLKKSKVWTNNYVGRLFGEDDSLFVNLYHDTNESFLTKEEVEADGELFYRMEISCTLIDKGSSTGVIADFYGVRRFNNTSTQTYFVNDNDWITVEGASNSWDSGIRNVKEIATGFWDLPQGSLLNSMVLGLSIGSSSQNDVSVSEKITAWYFKPPS